MLSYIELRQTIAYYTILYYPILYCTRLDETRLDYAIPVLSRLQLPDNISRRPKDMDPM